MAKKYLSEETVVDSDDSESSTLGEEEEVEAQPTHFQPPRSYIQIKDLRKPQLLNAKEIKSSKKEIWLIKMPKNLDISRISSIPVDSLGEATDFTTGDNKYSIVEDLTASASTADSKKNDQKLNILLPDSKTSYEPENELKIGRFYNIYEKVEIPEINYDKLVVQREDVEQEKNLRMRHFPTGYYIKDFEEAQEPIIPDPDKKRKADNIVDLDDEKKESKKSKKDKSEKKKKKKKDKKKL